MFYYFDRGTWGGTKTAADILAGIYGCCEGTGDSTGSGSI
jgi:hypothetical protein